MSHPHHEPHEDGRTRQALEQERTVLLAALCDLGNARAALESLQPEYFNRMAHMRIFTAMRRIAARDEVITYQTVRWELQQCGELERVGAAYLAALEVEGIRGMDVEPAIRWMRDAHCIRQYEKAATHLLAMTRAETSTIEQVDAFAKSTLARLSMLKGALDITTVPAHVSHIGEVLAQVKDRLKAGPPDFIDTPWPGLNRLLGGGFVAGELVLLGARPGFGKTAMALEIARRAAKQKHSVLVVSREMLKDAIGLRMVSQEGQVDALAMRHGRLTRDQWTTVDDACARMESLPVFMTHAPLRIEEIHGVVGALMAEAPLKLIIVDYLQLVGADPGIKDRRLQVEAVSSGLKALTLAYQTTVLCLSSLSRPPGLNQKPTLASLRESGAIEHDADSVMLLHRPDEMLPATQCIVAKARAGRQGVVDLMLEGHILTFHELAQGY